MNNEARTEQVFGAVREPRGMRTRSYCRRVDAQDIGLSFGYGAQGRPLFRLTVRWKQNIDFSSDFLCNRAQGSASLFPSTRHVQKPATQRHRVPKHCTCGRFKPWHHKNITHFTESRTLINYCVGLLKRNINIELDSGRFTLGWKAISTATKLRLGSSWGRMWCEI